MCVNFLPHKLAQKFYVLYRSAVYVLTTNQHVSRSSGLCNYGISTDRRCYYIFNRRYTYHIISRNTAHQRLSSRYKKYQDRPEGDFFLIAILSFFKRGALSRSKAGEKDLNLADCLVLTLSKISISINCQRPFYPKRGVFRENQPNTYYRFRSLSSSIEFSTIASVPMQKLKFHVGKTIGKTFWVLVRKTISRPQKGPVGKTIEVYFSIFQIQFFFCMDSRGQFRKLSLTS